MPTEVVNWIIQHPHPSILGTGALGNKKWKIPSLIFSQAYPGHERHWAQSLVLSPISLSLSQIQSNPAREPSSQSTTWDSSSSSGEAEFLASEGEGLLQQQWWLCQVESRWLWCSSTPVARWATAREIPVGRGEKRGRADSSQPICGSGCAILDLANGAWKRRGSEKGIGEVRAA